MEEINGKIKLNPIEQTALWWTYAIKFKAKEINRTICNTDEKRIFAKIFSKYSAIDWRNLYLKLVERITEEASVYTYKDEDDCFKQDTAPGGHDIINSILKEVTKKDIPDISLTLEIYKDFVTTTYEYYTEVLYKSCGIKYLPEYYRKEFNYILTGNQQELDFYYLIVALIVKLHKLNKDFSSMEELKSKFCEEYMKLNDITDYIYMHNIFEKAISLANDNKIIIGSAWGSFFFTQYTKEDINGIKEYMPTANHYASIILGISENKPKVKKTSKRRK